MHMTIKSIITISCKMTQKLKWSPYVYSWRSIIGDLRGYPQGTCIYSEQSVHVVQNVNNMCHSLNTECITMVALVSMLTALAFLVWLTLDTIGSLPASHRTPIDSQHINPTERLMFGCSQSLEACVYCVFCACALCVYTDKRVKRVIKLVF